MAKAPRNGPYICGIDAALDIVSGKWKGLILWELDEHGVRRFAELRRGLPGVSEKMLIQHLREMEEDGLVHREVYREVPPKVEYSLTEQGLGLDPDDSDGRFAVDPAHRIRLMAAGRAAAAGPARPAPPHRGARPARTARAGSAPRPRPRGARGPR